MNRSLHVSKVRTFRSHLLAMAAVVAGGAVAPSDAAAQCSAKIDGSVCQAMTASPTAFLPIMVKMTQQVTPQQIDQSVVNTTTKEDRILAVVTTLKDLARYSQETQQCGGATIKAQVQTAEAMTPPQAMAFQQLWIENAIALKAQRVLIEALAARDDVASVMTDEPVPAPEPEPTGCTEADPITETQWNVVRIGAPAAWARGFTGTDSVVGIVDTGVYMQHDDLLDAQGASRSVRNAGGTPLWFDPTMGCPPGQPCDDNGRGTYLLSVAVGNRPYGVAPDAKFLACKGVMADGSACPSHIEKCIEFLINPDHPGMEPMTLEEAKRSADVILVPHVFFNPESGVVNGQPVGECSVVDGLKDKFDKIRNSNIVPIVPIGDKEQTPGYPNSPGNWRTVMTVGATLDTSSTSSVLIDPNSRRAATGTLSLCDGDVSGPVAGARNVAAPTVLAPGRGVIGAYPPPSGTGSPRIQCGVYPSAVAAAQVAGAVALVRGATRRLCDGGAMFPNPCTLSALPPAYTRYGVDGQHFILDELLRRTQTCAPSEPTNPAQPGCSTATLGGRLNVDEALKDHSELDSYSVGAAPYYTEDYYRVPPTPTNDTGIAGEIKAYNWGPFPWRGSDGHRLAQVTANWQVQRPPVPPATQSTWIVEPLPIAPTSGPVVYPGSAPATFSRTGVGFKFRPNTTVSANQAFQWQMERGGVRFGPKFPDPALTMLIRGTDRPQLQSITPAPEDVADSIASYGCTTVTIRIRNDGTNPWTPLSVWLKSASASWSHIYMAGSPSTSVYDFSGSVCAPVADGQYQFKFDLVRSDGSLVPGGQALVNRTLVVRNSYQNNSGWPLLGDGYLDQPVQRAVSVTNTGNRAWGAGTCFGSLPFTKPSTWIFPNTNGCVAAPTIIRPGQGFTGIFEIHYDEAPARFLWGMGLRRSDGAFITETGLPPGTTYPRSMTVGVSRTIDHRTSWPAVPAQGQDNFSYRRWDQHGNTPGEGDWDLLTRRLQNGEYRFESPSGNIVVRETSVLPGDHSPAAIFWMNPYSPLNGHVPVARVEDVEVFDYGQCGGSPNGNGVAYVSSNGNLTLWNQGIAQGAPPRQVGPVDVPLSLSATVRFIFRSRENATCDRTVTAPRITILPPPVVGAFPMSSVNSTAAISDQNWPPFP
ncbi:MAG TPA: S8 family serine peptidase [Candidatus Binatia bacterium]|jgi:hypothetical protein|nr:S8 family serine peptidase [Candidatus Binatia bacterium]